MLSIRARIFRSFLRKKINLNPINMPDPVSLLRDSEKLSDPDEIIEGVSFHKEHTPDGTPYERAVSEGGSNGKLIFFLHGGAYIMGMITLYRRISPSLIRAGGGCEIIFPDYRLAPENTYPSQLEDAERVWKDVTERQGYSPENIVIMGDSAGANLALALMQKLRDEGKPLPRAGVCVSVWGDMTLSGKSYLANYSHDPMFGAKGRKPSEDSRQALMESSIFCFVGDADRTHPYVSPIFGDFHDFPPMLFTVGSHEMLLDDTLTIVDKLKENNVPVTCEIGKGMFHIYPLCAKFFPEAMVSYKKILEFISAHLT